MGSGFWGNCLVNLNSTALENFSRSLLRHSRLLLTQNWHKGHLLQVALQEFKLCRPVNLKMSRVERGNLLACTNVALVDSGLKGASRSSFGKITQAGLSKFFWIAKSLRVIPADFLEAEVSSINVHMVFRAK